jgi:polysaccharide export outer membrane protein
MKAIAIIRFLLVILIISCSAHQNVQESKTVVTQDDQKQNPEVGPSPFLLGVGDEINISVWRHDDLNRSVNIDPQGNIFFPLVGEISAAGMTLSELRDTITLKLSKYIVDPVVDINATGIQSQKYYILGEVRAPGMFAFSQKTNVLGGIIQAGGFTDDADMKKILLMHNNRGVYKAKALNLDIADITESAQLAFSTHLENGDIVYVPPKLIADIERFMIRLNNIIIPIVNLERAIIQIPDVYDVITEGEIDRDDTGAIVPP